jgi:hypothetical protein
MSWTDFDIFDLMINSINEKWAFSLEMQLVLCNYSCCMQLKNVACKYFLVAYDMCSCIRQVAKNIFSTTGFIMRLFEAFDTCEIGKATKVLLI